MATVLDSSITPSSTSNEHNSSSTSSSDTVESSSPEEVKINPIKLDLPDTPMGSPPNEFPMSPTNSEQLNISGTDIFMAPETREKYVARMQVEIESMEFPEHQELTNKQKALYDHSKINCKIGTFVLVVTGLYAAILLCVILPLHVNDHFKKYDDELRCNLCEECLDTGTHPFCGNVEEGLCCNIQPFCCDLRLNGTCYKIITSQLCVKVKVENEGKGNNIPIAMYAIGAPMFVIGIFIFVALYYSMKQKTVYIKRMEKDEADRIAEKMVRSSNGIDLHINRNQMLADVVREYIRSRVEKILEMESPGVNYIVIIDRYGSRYFCRKRVAGSFSSDVYLNV